MRVVKMQVHLLQSQWTQMHNISNVEIQNPVLYPLYSQKSFHIGREKLWEIFWSICRGYWAHPSLSGLLNAWQELILACDRCGRELILLFHELTHLVVGIKFPNLVLKHFEDRVDNVDKVLQLLFIFFIKVKWLRLLWDDHLFDNWSFREPQNFTFLLWLHYLFVRTCLSLRWSRERVYLWKPFLLLCLTHPLHILYCFSLENRKLKLISIHVTEQLRVSYQILAVQHRKLSMLKSLLVFVDLRQNSP